MAYEEEAAASKADDEKVAMEILGKEYDWYKDLGENMDKSFNWSKLGDDDSQLFLEALTSLCKPRRILCDLMDSIEIHHKDFSNHKSLINDQRAKFYDYLFGISHKFSDLALKDYFASFQPSINSLPFPCSDSKEDGETSSQSKNSNIGSKSEPLEMITKIRKSSLGEEVDDEAEEEESSDTYYPEPPSVLECMHCISMDYGVYHDHDHSDLNYRFDDNQDDYYFD